MKNLLKSNRAFLQNKKVLFKNSQKIKSIVDILNKDRVVLISGMRFAWKTKFLCEMIEKTGIWEKAFYFNKELDNTWRIKTSEDLESLIEAHTKTYQAPKILILQNISKIEWIKSFIGKVYEEKLYKLVIVWNNLKIEGIQEIEIHNVETPKLIRNDEQGKSNIKEIMQYGSIEEVALLKDSYLRGFILENIKTSIIAKDIVYAYSIKNSFLYNQTLSFLSSIDEFISLREFNRRLEEASIDISLITTIDYINFTLNSKLVKRMYRYDLKLRKEITSKAKYYFSDTGLRNAIHGSSLNSKILIENLIYNEITKKGYSIQWWIYGRFEFDFLATPWAWMKDEDLYIHISKESDKNEIQKEARKLAKAIPEQKKIKTDIDIFSEAPIGHGEVEKEVPRDIRKILLVKNLSDISIRKKNISWVEIIDLDEFITSF